jgi:hypothetical protein
MSVEELRRESRVKTKVLASDTCYDSRGNRRRGIVVNFDVAWDGHS